MAQSYPGNQAGTSSSKFRVYVQYRTTTQEETRAYVQRKFSVHVDSGNFGGSHLALSWGGQVSISGVGWYGDSGWKNVGWVNYGAKHTSSCSASYTGSSGTRYSSSVTATYTPDVPTWAPKAPTGVTASRVSDSKVVVWWTRSATTARPYAGVYVERSVDNGQWAKVAVLGGTATEYTDGSTAANHRYSYRVRAKNGAGYSGYASSGWVYTTPDAPGSCVNTRNGDTSNSVIWTLGSSDTGLYSGHKVERRVNGGAWSQIATVGAGATSYTDTTTAANNSYAYRVRSYNGAGNSGYATSRTTYNTPAAPGTPSVARTSDTGVEGSFSNDANTATALEVQRSSDRSTWVPVGVVEGIATTFADNPGGGTFYYRIRNTRGSLVSGWVTSGAVVTICAPSAPTLTAPASSVVVPKSQQTVAVRWKHNPIDGSAQTSAQVRWSTDGGSNWVSDTVSGASLSYSLANGFSVNATVTVQVRTKGAHASYGPWSASRMFFVYQVPTVTIEQPASSFVVENMPIHVRISYSDPSGSLADARMSIASGGSEVYSRDVTGQMEFDITVADWVPENGVDYRISVSARSTSTLQASAWTEFSIEFQPPSMAVVDAVPDPDSGYVAVTVRRISDGLQDIDKCSLYRVCGGEAVLVADGLSDGDTVVDKYAPLNTDFDYMTAAFAKSGAVSQGVYPGSVSSKYSFFYWGETGIARAHLDVEDDFGVESVHELVSVAGSEYPIVVMSDETDETHSFSAKVYGRDEAMRFYDMGKSHLPVVYKSAYGLVSMAVAVPNISKMLGISDLWTVSIGLKRIAGDPL